MSLQHREQQPQPPSQRPVYVPQRQRKQQRQRQRQQQQEEIDRRIVPYFRSDDFVGDPQDQPLPAAASINNNHNHTLTVYSTLQQRQQQQQQQQCPEDFMDEQDHNEWGGPVRVRPDYDRSATTTTVATATATTAAAAAGATSIADSFLFPSRNSRSSSSGGGGGGGGGGGTQPILHHNDSIGQRLLKQLGWRGQHGTKDGTITAYVPANSNDGSQNNTESSSPLSNRNDRSGGEQRPPPPLQHSENENEIIILSDRRWRKIVKQQAIVRIPEPWKGTVGLGYVSLQNAPEFQAFHAARQKRAAVNHHQKSVYRVANVLPPPPPPPLGRQTNDVVGKDHEPSQQSQSMMSNSTTMAYETTVEDFVGTKSSAGFALRDDEDDAYDDDGDDPNDRWPTAAAGIHAHTTALTVRSGGRRSPRGRDPPLVHRPVTAINSNVYDTIAYEHVDSDQEDSNNNYYNDTKPQATAVADFGGVFSSWATATAAAAGTSDETRASSAATTHSGCVPLPGFVWGGGSQAQKEEQQLFRGPDIPKDWLEDDATTHVFGPTEHPSIFKALSHAVQLERVDERRRTALDEALKAAAVKPTRNMASPPAVPLPPPPPPPPPKNNLFAGVGAAMKSRFTVSSSATLAVEAGTVLTSGLSQGGPVSTENDDVFDATDKFSPAEAHPQQQQQQHDFDITRTMLAFHPEPLLCKRFRVAVVPSGEEVSAASTAVINPRTREEAYFYDQIMAEALAFPALTNGGGGGGGDGDTTTTTRKRGQNLSLLDELAADSNDEEAVTRRPPMAVYKSIFEPERCDNSVALESNASSEDDTKLTTSVSVALVVAADRSLVAANNADSANSIAGVPRDNGFEQETSGALVLYDNNNNVTDRRKSRAADKTEKHRKQSRDGRKRRTRSFSDDDSRHDRRRSKDERRHRDEKKKRNKSRQRESDD